MKERIITALIAIAVFVPVVWYGGLLFTIAIYALASIGLFELIRMKGLSFVSLPTMLTGLLLWLILIPSHVDLFGSLEITKVEITFIIVLLLLSYTVLSKNTFTFDDASFLLTATIYVAMGFYYMNETRSSGLEYIFYAFFIIWATDTGAYFIGKAIGKRKLWPEISPNKTVEGSVGGILCAVVIALIYNAFVPISDHIFFLIAVTVAVSAFGQIGDLVESAFKRHYGVKDSGKILPGHGGILDRFDSLLFVLPLLHFLHFI
ncbi:phosphatidate cytidylyltransferase [Ectobacillus sp. JY-23]|uniref:phosphatidate cytidylyltransferase n=1 Tax=Ectobacillus sp. JY-23 TaxID=2933872 RepID=UPI001FF2E3F5|nr:phosphatidate cytidylyltransferase [Ectobacillus sp. JY-23]UOY93643.1 phosphatidate cytidylyltransferase [Ectobacillus sp. JY-23]